MKNPELSQWLDEQEYIDVIKKIAFPDKMEHSEAHSITKKKLHMKILAETGASMFSQYWKIIELAAEAGWPAIDKVKHLSADEFSVSAALAWMKGKGIELKPFPKIDGNPDLYQ